MYQGLEKDIERCFRASVAKRGGLALKFVSPGFTGVPDRIVFFPGRVFFVELKRPGLDLSLRQRFVKKIIESFGFKVYKIDSKEQIKNILDGI